MKIVNLLFVFFASGVHGEIWTDRGALVQRLAVSKQAEDRSSQQTMRAANVLAGFNNLALTRVKNITLRLMERSGRHTSAGKVGDARKVRFALAQRGTAYFKSIEHKILDFRSRAAKRGQFVEDKGAGCNTWCKATIAVDALLFALGAFGINCGPATLMLYYALGLSTLIEDQGLSVPDALLMLGQMSTTVGYGSSCPECAKDGTCAGLELFHSLHSWVGVVMVNSQWDEAVKFWANSVVRKLAESWKIPHAFVAVIFLLLELAASTAVYAEDLRESSGSPDKSYAANLFDALYMSLMTFSSVGYGDLSPGTDWGKTISPIYMQLGTYFFNMAKEAIEEGSVSEGVKPGDAFVGWYSSCLPEDLREDDVNEKIVDKVVEKTEKDQERQDGAQVEEKKAEAQVEEKKAEAQMKIKKNKKKLKTVPQKFNNFFERDDNNNFGYEETKNKDNNDVWYKDVKQKVNNFVEGNNLEDDAAQDISTKKRRK